ncbi:MAG TPA: hypothetical protein PK199_06200 [Bacteroidales bacterium]|nr:hypothetical protein [Bacteroidales bacterium]
MKKIIFLLSLFVIGITSIQAQIPADKAVKIPEGKALIYISRPSAALGAFRMVNKIDEVELKTTGGRQHVYLIVDPGKHKVICKGSTKESILEVDAKAGKTYMVVQQVASPVIGVYYARLSLTEDPAKMGKYLKKSDWSN